MHADPSDRTNADRAATLLRQYGCGPIRFVGADEALYEHHLVFDNVLDPALAGERERFEAVARAVRDVLSQRWVLTEATYARENPERVYYLSMEFLIGRALANNVTNLLLDPLERWPRTPRRVLPRFDGDDAAPGHGLRPALRVRHLPADDYGWQQEQADHWLRRPDPWEVARPHERVDARPPWPASRTIGPSSATADGRSTRCACGPRRRPGTSTSASSQRRFPGTAPRSRWPRRRARSTSSCSA